MDSPFKNILARLSGVMPSGDSGREFTCCCPVHGDQHNSMKVTEGKDGRVLIKCYAGCETRDILKAIDLEYRDLFPGRIEKPLPAGIGVGVLAIDKRIPAKFLREQCGLTDEIGRGKNGGRRVLIPYYDTARELLYTRYRSALKATEGSSYDRGTKPRAYGLWRLPQYRAAGGRVLILVEGESDSWTLWLPEHDYPALGIPGADAVDALQAEDIDGFDTIYVWQDADGAGAKFVVRMAARIAELAASVPGGRAPTVLVISSTEWKDPNRLLQLFGEGQPFKSRFDACLAAARAPVITEEEAKEATTDFAPSDMGNAQRLVARHGRDIRYSDEMGRWYVWSGRNWKSCKQGPIHHRAKITVRSIVKELTGITDDKKRQSIYLHASRSESKRAIFDMVKLAESDPSITISTSDLDADRFMLNVLNGTIDLRTGKLLPHRREDLITRFAPVEYDPAATCQTWKVFLARVFAVNPEDFDDRGNEQTIQFMKRLLGYCLTADTSEQVLPIFWGGGSNGKTTLLNVVRDILGPDYSAKAPRNLLMAKRNDDSAETELAVLFGSRLVVAAETKRGQRLSEDLVKDLTGTESIRARYRYHDSFEFLPTHKLIMGTNHRPRIPESDDAIWRRLMPVPFKTKFWNPARGEFGPDHLRRDNGLADKLRAEHTGILAWLVRGCMEWQANGLGVPDDIQKETEAYRGEEDKTAQYIAERCQVSNGLGNTKLADVFADYCKWCEASGHRPYSRNEFAADLRSHNIVVKPGSHNVTHCFGLRITNNSNVSDLSDLD